MITALVIKIISMIVFCSAIFDVVATNSISLGIPLICVASGYLYLHCGLRRHAQKLDNLHTK